MNLIDLYEQKSPLLLSIEYKYTTIVSYFLQHPETDVHIFDKSHDNALSYLLNFFQNENELFPLIQIYVEKTNGFLTHQGKTILQITLQHGFFWISKFLIEKSQIYTHNTDSDGNTILRYIIFSVNLNFENKCSLLRYCHEKKCNFFHKNNYGHTIFDLCGLHHENQFEILKCLDKLMLENFETEIKKKEFFHNHCKIC